MYLIAWVGGWHLIPAILSAIGVGIVSGAIIVAFFFCISRPCQTEHVEINDQKTQAIKQAIASLDPSEWEAINRFTKQQRNTLDFPLDTPLVAGLLKKNIFVRASAHGHLDEANDGEAYMFFPMMLSPLAKKYLPCMPPQQPGSTPLHD